ncbi:hypothetical protein K2X33_13255 [bacterium]|nr:hypothetical protein [bacterium]
MLSEILKSLTARNAEEESLLQTILGIAQSFHQRGHKDLGLAAVTGESQAADLQLLTSLPEEARTQFFGLVEALEIYQSIHGTATSLLNLNETAVTELRKIRDICLQGGTHAFY